MPDLTPTTLIPAAATSAHAELLRALGTENNPGQWMLFMEAVTRLLPDVLSSGRPTKEAINRCAIGQLGFTSWQAMIEAPTDISGLGWNFSQWKAWRRAWSVVQEHQWLLDEEMTSSELNTLANDLRRDGLQFPGSAGELETIRKGRKGAQDARRAESIEGLTKRAEAAEAALQTATAQSKTLSEQLAQVQGQLATAIGQIAEQAEALGVLKTEKAQAVSERDKWKRKALDKPEPAQVTPHLGLLQRLWHWLFGTK